MKFFISVIRFAFPISEIQISYILGNGIQYGISMNSDIVKHNLINLLSSE